MGYDSDECLRCYCHEGYNNPTLGKAWTCMKCIDGMIEGHEDNPRVMIAVEEWSKYNRGHGEWMRDNKDYCQVCGKVGCVVLQVPTCETHERVEPRNRIEEREDEDLEFDSDYDSE